MEGTIKWNGKGQDGGKLSPSIYVFYAEIFHAETGERKVYKRAFLVR